MSIKDNKKVALCLSGQLRSVKAGYEYIKKNLLDQYNVDVFLHTWNNGPSIHWVSIHESYKPLIAKDSIVFNGESIDRKYPKVASVKHPARNTVSMYYSVFMANLLKKEYELEKGFTYDAVVRCRTDYALNIVPDILNMELNKVYVPNCRMVPDRNFCNDQFAYGSSRVMDAYSETFCNLDKLYEMGFPMNAEEMLSGNLQLNRLVGDNLVYVDMRNPFPPGPLNGTTHSLIREDFREWNNLR